MRSGTFQICVKGEMQDVKGYIYSLLKFGDILVHRDVTHPTYWRASEPRTGSAIALGKTRDAAVEEAHRILKEVGVDEYLSTIEASENKTNYER